MKRKTFSNSSSKKRKVIATDSAPTEYEDSFNNNSGDAPFVDDIKDLFDMGFISIEEVDYFDPKTEQTIKKKDKATEVEDSGFEFGNHEDFAMKSGWTVSTLKPENQNEKRSESKKPQKNKQKNNPPQTKSTPNTKPVTTVDIPSIGEDEMKEWKCFDLNQLLLQGLKAAGFLTPMPIQAAALRALLLEKKHDLLGSAPTGSGKTLAFALPILNDIIINSDNNNNNNTKNGALIIVPTRELAVQIEKHIKMVSTFVPPGKIRLATVIGGLSEAKQSRQLSHQPNVIIATPGRLKELMEFDQSVRAHIVSIKYLVLDEADRMVQVGHFQELETILTWISSDKSVTKQTFLFSATLNNAAKSSASDQLKRLCQKLGLNRNSSDLAYLNLAGRPATLQESYSLCSSQDDKESTLLEFLQALRSTNTDKSFGRILLFANSIDTLRRLSHLLGLCRIPCISIHAQMQQRQRLNNLDRFKATRECLLLASDVAARGIDIVGVDRVIHFQLPKNRDTYIHRCGRTARASYTGTSLALISPDERKLAESCGLIGSKNESEIIKYVPDQSSIHNLIIPILKLARSIERTEHSIRSARSEINWAQKMAEECELVLDEDNDPAFKKRQEHQQINQKALDRDVSAAKSKLEALLNNLNNN